MYIRVLPSWKADDVVLAESFKLLLTVSLKFGIHTTLMVSQNIEVLFLASHFTEGDIGKG